MGEADGAFLQPPGKGRGLAGTPVWVLGCRKCTFVLSFCQWKKRFLWNQFDHWAFLRYISQMRWSSLDRAMNRFF